MKKLRVLILSVIILIGILFVLSYSYIHLFAKDHITSFLKQTIDENLTIEHITYAFPFGLAFKNMAIPSYGKVKELRIFISPLSFFSTRMKVRNVEMLNPTFKLTGKEKLPSDPTPPPTNKSQRNTESSSALYIQTINIRDGQITYHENKIEKIQGHIDHITLPFTEEQIDFTLRGKVLKNGLNAIMQTHGWLNWAQKNMLAKLLLQQENTNNEIHANLDAANNQLIVSGEMKITGVLDKSVTNSKMVQSILQSSIDSDEATLQTKFTFQTLLDRPHIEKIQFSGDLISSLP